MKIKVIVIDPELSSRGKRILAAVVVPALLLSGAAVAWAGTLHQWKTGDTLTADALNGNFAAVEADISDLKSQLGGLQAIHPLTVLDELNAVPGDSYYSDCASQTLSGGDSFLVGACARMANYKCGAAGYRTGWFEGDIDDGSIGIVCIK